MRQPQTRNGSSSCAAPERKLKTDVRTRKKPFARMKPKGAPKLRPHRGLGALARRRGLGGKQCRAGPFSAQSQALAESQQRKKRRREQSDRVIGRQQSHGEGCEPHEQQRKDQRGFAAHPVAKMAEQNRTDGPGDKGDAESGHRSEKRGRSFAFGEEQEREHRDGGRRIHVEIEKLDRRPDHARDNDPPPFVTADSDISTHFRSPNRANKNDKKIHGGKPEPSGRPPPIPNTRSVSAIYDLGRHPQYQSVSRSRHFFGKIATVQRRNRYSAKAEERAASLSLHCRGG